MRAFHLLVLALADILLAVGAFLAGSRRRDAAVAVACISAALGLLSLYQLVAVARAP